MRRQTSRAPRTVVTRTVGRVALALTACALLSPGTTAAQEAVVHAVLFYSPTCPHCHKVITQDLPPLVEKYGERFVIIGVDVTTQQGSALYQATVADLGIEQSRLGVPTLVVGRDVMVGDAEIPQQLPGLIEKGLAAGGVDWPPVQALRQALASQGVPTEGAAAADSAAAQDSVPPPGTTPRVDSAPAPTPAVPPSVEGLGEMTREVSARGPWANFRRDPVANGLAVLVLLGMLVSIAASVASLARSGPAPLRLPTWAFPVLSALGMAVASYLALVEITGAEAVCGPVGNCNAVQQSPWAMLFGIPVGLLGQAGYLAIFAAWALGVLGPTRWKDSAWLALWLMALVGTVFSAYLTVLEPFVIGATCMWCLTSSVMMTLLLLGATSRVPRSADGTS